MSRHAARRSPRGLTHVALAVGAVTLVALGAGSQGSLAVFRDSASVSAGTAVTSTTAFTAGTIAVPIAPMPTRAPTSVALNWSATAVGSNGGTAPNYDVLRYPTLTGGTATLICDRVTALTCTDTATLTGTVYYAVRARIGTNWVKEGSRTAYTVGDTTSPTVTITTPLDSCGPSTVACGTAVDTGGGTVGSVEYSLQRRLTDRATGLIVTYSCWNGTAWSTPESVGDAPCPYQAAGGTTAAWTVPGSKNTAYTNAGLGQVIQLFTLDVRATDSFGNVSAAVSATFTRS